MARLVTRVTSKNFCLINPSFELSAVTDLEGIPMVQVTGGQACINGMDIIATQDLRIYMPDEAGTYLLALHLWRDRNGNVFGDDIVGIGGAGIGGFFSGVYLDWWTEKDENDTDILWLGSVTWNGTEITDIQEDLDKYGRIWAKDILCKLEDWKHPDNTRMILQDWIYKTPDWYVSKEGDVVFGAIEFLAGRDEDVDGTLANHQDLGTGLYGTRIEAIDENNARMVIKAPSVLESDIDNLFIVRGTNNGTILSIGQSEISSTSTDNYNLNILSPNEIVINATDNLNLKSDSQIKIEADTENVLVYGNTGVTIASGNNQENSKITVEDDLITFSDASCSLGDMSIEFGSNTLSQYWCNTPAALTGIKVTGSDATISTALNTFNINAGTNNTGTVNVGANTFRVSGDIRANRVFNAVYNDIAEFMEKYDSNEVITAGDIVVFMPDGRVTKAINAVGPDCANRIAGIVSGPETMGYVLGGEGLTDDERVPVGLAGRVYLNVGELAVQAGDLIALKNDGTLEIVSDYTRAVVGKATKASDNGRVYVLIK